MTGKSLLIGFGYINPRYYIEAENDIFVPNTKTKKFRHTLFVAAMVILTLLLVGCALTYTYDWLTAFFNRQINGPLSSEQSTYIKENGQVIKESQTHDGWTIQLKSVINDGRTGYILLGIKAPRKFDLESYDSGEYILGSEFAELISNNRQIELLSAESGWEPDDDGRANTMDYIIRFEPMMTADSPNPFGSDIKWNIHIPSIIYQHTNDSYAQELLDNKHKWEDEFFSFDKKTDELYQQEVIVDGIWDFAFSFAQSNDGLQLVSIPVTLKAYTTKDKTLICEDVNITSFMLHSFSAVITHEANALVTFTNQKKESIAIVMCDGTEIELKHFSTTRDTTILNSPVPIVLEEVFHIRMPDGTILTAAQ